MGKKRSNRLTYTKQRIMKEKKCVGIKVPAAVGA